MGAAIAAIQIHSGFETSVCLTILGTAIGAALLGAISIAAAKALPEVPDISSRSLSGWQSGSTPF